MTTLVSFPLFSTRRRYIFCWLGVDTNTAGRIIVVLINDKEYLNHNWGLTLPYRDKVSSESYKLLGSILSQSII